MNLPKVRETVDRWLADYNHSARLVREEGNNLTRLNKEIEQIQEAQKFVQAVAQDVQEKVHQKLAGVVSNCLSAIFDEPYEFKIHFDRKRGRTEARVVFCRGDMELDPISETEGGAIDVAAFALRLACVTMSRPSLRKVLIVDEPFRNLHSEVYRERLREMLVTVAEEMQFQIILVTQEDGLCCGNVIDFGQ